MMKLQRRCIAVVLLSLFVFSTSWAIDYTKLSSEELFEFRGAVKNGPEAEQKVYEQEWQKRLDAMTEEEKKRYSEEPGRAGQQNNVAGEGERAPFVSSRGYDKQGTGGVLYGGGMPSRNAK